MFGRQQQSKLHKENKTDLFSSFVKEKNNLVLVVTGNTY